MPWDIRLDPQAYKWLASCGSYQCVAPTKRGTRCSITVDSADQRKASVLFEEIKTLQDDDDSRNERIRAFILQSCCRKWHRDLLWNDEETGCLDNLVDIYAEYIDTILASQPDPVEGKVLRSGKVVASSSATLEQYSKRPSYFVSYDSGPCDSIRDDIQQSVNGLRDARGNVYSFYWPSHPGYVKIGYTSRHIEDRMAEWEDCHPGAVWSKSKHVAYPERMERLIHLQMADHRRKIIRCKYCFVSHIEWFELPTDTVDQIIEDWIEVAKRQPLYGSDGYLTAAWVRRIYNFKGTITARALLDVLDAEDALEQVAIALAKKREELASMKQEVSKTIDNFEQSKKELPQQVIDNSIDKPAVAPAASVLPIQLVQPSQSALPATSSSPHLAQPIQPPKPELIVLPKAHLSAEPVIAVPHNPAQEDQILTFFADFMFLLAQAQVQAEAVKTSAFTFTSSFDRARPTLRPVSRVRVA